MDVGRASKTVKHLALELGFDAVGITSAGSLERAEGYRRWLDDSMAGQMQYLHGNVVKRLAPALLMPQARSVISVGLNCFNRLPLESAEDVGRRVGKVAMYAWGRDYHSVIKSKLQELAEALQQRLGENFMWRAFVDTAPVWEAPLAQRAGLGWIGKNSCLISRQFGPYLLLGELFTSLELLADEPASNNCGDCSRCVGACPTGAIVRAGLVDARKCISYLTIEHRESIDSNLWQKMGNWLFGCDLCLQACPYGAMAQSSACQDFTDLVLGPELGIVEVLNWDQERYKLRCEGSAGLRARLPMWQRNALIAAGNAIEAGDWALGDIIGGIKFDDGNLEQYLGRIARGQQ